MRLEPNITNSLFTVFLSIALATLASVIARIGWRDMCPQMIAFSAFFLVMRIKIFVDDVQAGWPESKWFCQLYCLLFSVVPWCAWIIAAASVDSGLIESSRWITLSFGMFTIGLLIDIMILRFTSGKLVPTIGGSQKNDILTKEELYQKFQWLLFNIFLYLPFLATCYYQVAIYSHIVSFVELLMGSCCVFAILTFVALIDLSLSFFWWHRKEKKAGGRMKKEEGQ